MLWLIGDISGACTFGFNHLCLFPCKQLKLCIYFIREWRRYNFILHLVLCNIFDKRDIGIVTLLYANGTTRPFEKKHKQPEDFTRREMWLVLLGDNGSKPLCTAIYTLKACFKARGARKPVYRSAGEQQFNMNPDHLLLRFPKIPIFAPIEKVPLHCTHTVLSSRAWRL